MMRYPCSYMIQSEAFEALPAMAKEHVYRRLWDILAGADRSGTYETVSDTDRKAIAEILMDTKDDLPAYWVKNSPNR